METKQQIYNLLQQLNISFSCFDHEPADTMEKCEQIDRIHHIQAEHCKNLFLCNRQETEYYLLLLGANKKFRTAEVSKQLGKTRFSFGKEEPLFQLLHCKPGAISPLGLIFDTEQAVTVLMDQDLFSCEALCLHPCENTASVVIRTKDFLNIFLPFTKHAVTAVQVTSFLVEKV